MVHINHRVGIKAALEKVYEALSTIEGLSSWWTESTSGVSEIGKDIVFRFLTMEGKEIGGMRMRVKQLLAGKKVHWVCEEGPEEWIGTEIIFDLHQEDGYTIVMFQHRNWREEVEFKAHCSMKWGIFLLSLKDLVEKGRGMPSPNDIKIDNWN